MCESARRTRDKIGGGIGVAEGSAILEPGEKLGIDLWHFGIVTVGDHLTFQFGKVLLRVLLHHPLNQGLADLFLVARKGLQPPRRPRRQIRLRAVHFGQTMTLEAADEPQYRHCIPRSITELRSIDAKSAETGGFGRVAP